MLTELPEMLDLNGLGIEPAEVTQVCLIHEKRADRLYRVNCAGRRVVIKWFADPAESIEIRAYSLLEALGVPTLPVHGRTENALVLQDLAAGPTWRLAAEADCRRADVGRAVAAWYRALHQAGRKLLADPLAVPDFLRREDDALDPAAVLDIGERLGLSGSPVWRLCAEHIEALKRAIRARPATLTYNDFHWSNLALARAAAGLLEAVVFDYHLLGIGMAYSDCRNVLGCLGGPAASAFKDAYGPFDRTEALLDGPVAVLAALSEAVCRPKLPGWAGPLVRQATSGELERGLRRALENRAHDG